MFKLSHGLVLRFIKARIPFLTRAFVSVLFHSICQHIWKNQQWQQDGKKSVFILIPKKSNAKECSNYHTIVLISHGSKVMLKILQARTQQYVNRELSDVQRWVYKRQKNQRSNCQHPLDHWKSKRVPKKKNISALLIMPKPLTVWTITNSGKFLKRWEYQTTLPVSWETWMQVKKQ